MSNEIKDFINSLEVDLCEEYEGVGVIVGVDISPTRFINLSYVLLKLVDWLGHLRITYVVSP